MDPRVRELVMLSALAAIIVCDLETVPDLAGFAAANDLVGRSDVEVREAIGDKFPKWNPMISRVPSSSVEAGLPATRNCSAISRNVLV